MRKLISALLCCVSFGISAEPYLVLTIEGEASGEVVINLRPDLAPKHVERVIELSQTGAYDNVVFHRVIEGFMAQTGDVEHGVVGGNINLAGTGGSDLPDLPAEFSNQAFDKGVVGMARSSAPNSANSQFFIMFEDGHFLNNQYTVFGEVVEGQAVVDAIKKGDSGQNGAIQGDPDFIAKAVIVDSL